MDPFSTIYGTEWFRDLDNNLVHTNQGVFPLEPVGGDQTVAIGTLAEVNALVSIGGDRTVAVGTLAELNALISLVSTLDGSTDILLTLDLTDATVLGQALTAMGLGQPRGQRIYHPDRRIVRG